MDREVSEPIDERPSPDGPLGSDEDAQVRTTRGGPLRFIRRYPDHFGLTFVALLAGVLRFVRLDIPKAITFDETYYAKDACWYVNVSKAVCEVDYEQTFVHPPLGKWLIAIGIRIFGHDSYGWRVAAAVAGTITVMLLYLLARRILKSSLAAVLASGLLAIDLLHFVQSRISMLDIFPPLFGVAAVLFAVYDRDRYRPPPDGPKANGLLDRPWRLAAGACAGAAAASKWPGIFYLVLVIVLTVLWEVSDRRADGRPYPISRMLREEFLTLFFWLLVMPAAVYAFTFLGRIEGAFLANPLAEGSWIRTFWDRQFYMLDFHTNLKSPHPYQSSARTWLLLKRPVSYHIEYGPHGEYGETMAAGSPFVWWASVLALSYAAFRWVAYRVKKVDHALRLRLPEGIIVGGFLFTYGPWLIPDLFNELAGLIGIDVTIADRPATFLFYLVPTVPFMCLALAYVATEIGRTWEAKTAIALFAAGAIGFFAFYYPIVANVQISKNSWDRRIWIFTKCDKPPGIPTTSTITLNPTARKPKTTVQETTSDADLPPKGWCWI